MYALGIDLGSTTIKYVLLDGAGASVARNYVRHKSAVAETLIASLRELAQAHPEVRLVEAKNPERIDQQRYNLRVGIYGGLAEDIGVILVKSAQPALLLALVAVIFPYGKPFDRPADCACARADHSGQRGSHFRAHSHGSVAFVDELKQLRLYLFAAFFGEELELFENRRLEFAKAVRARHGAPSGQ